MLDKSSQIFLFSEVYNNDKQVSVIFFFLFPDAKPGRTPTMKSTLFQYNFLNCMHLRAKGKTRNIDFLNNTSSVQRNVLSGDVQEIKHEEDLFCLELETEKTLQLTQPLDIIINTTVFKLWFQNKCNQSCKSKHFLSMFMYFLCLIMLKYILAYRQDVTFGI